EGAKGAAPDCPRLCRRLCALRPDHGSDLALDRLPAGRQVRRSGTDVSERHLHHSCAARGPARTVDSLRLRCEGPAGRAADHGQLFRRGENAGRRAPLPAGHRLAPARARRVQIAGAAMKRIAILLCFVSAQALSQEQSETREFLGQLGGRTALLHLYAITQPDGSARVTGEYLLLPTMQQRYLEGERSKQLGVMVLKEGNSPILYGRPPTATLQGTWTGGVFKGGRLGP